jgi:hypothetical protein
VHDKSLAAQETRALLTARKLLPAKRHDVEMSLRGVRRGFGLKVGPTTARTFEARVHELVDGHPTLQTVAEALLAARAELLRRFKDLEKWLLAAARAEERVRRLTTVPPTPRGGPPRDPGRRRAGGADLHRRDRRSHAVPLVAAGGRRFRTDAEPRPVGRDRRRRADLGDRRPRRPADARRGGQRHADAASEGLGLEGLGACRRQACRAAQGAAAVSRPPRLRRRIARPAGARWSRSPASSPSSCTGCSSTAPPSSHGARP